MDNGRFEGRAGESRLRIVSGEPDAVEAQLNELMGRYAAVQWNWLVINNRPWVNVVLLHESVLRMMQIAQAGQNVRMS